MSFSYDSEDYFSTDDLATEEYRAFDSLFTNTADFLLVAFEHQPDVFDTAFISNLKTFSRGVRKDSNVLRVTGIHNYKYLKKTPFALIQSPALSSTELNTAFQKDRILKDPRAKNLLINKDGTSVCLLLQIHKSISTTQSDDVIHLIYDSAAKAGLATPKIAGKIYTESAYVKQLKEENLRLTPLFVLIVSIVLLLLYRSIIASLLPTLSVIAGLIILYGYAAWIGRDINIASLMFPTVMAVVGMADLIHFYTKYQDEIESGKAKLSAIMTCLSELRMTLFLTSLTTMIGFLCVSYSPVPYVHSFGLDSAVGVAIAFLIAIFLTPVLLYYVPLRLVRTHTNNWEDLLDGIYRFGISNTKSIVYGALVLLAISVYGISQVNTNNTLLDAIGDKSKLKQEFQYIEEEFAGVRTLELVIQMKDNNQIDDLPTLLQIDKLESYLSSLPNVGYVIGPTAYYKSLQDAHHGSQLAHYTLPKSTKEFGRLAKTKPPVRNPLIQKQANKGLITLRMDDVGRVQMDHMIDDLSTWEKANLPDAHFSISTTGRHRLIDKTNELMVESLFYGLATAMLLIIGIICFLFRSTKMMLISLVPNLFPLALTGGIMGYAGLELNGSSAIIFTIAFVIAIDDTLHFLNKFAYLQKTNPQYSNEEVIRQTILQAGKAILVTSLILISGYSILLLSEFKEAYYHGVLISLTLIWAVISDLLLLPILLRKYLPR